MSLYNTTNIKELPKLEEIIDGNYIIVENEQGTFILDFEDFVVGPNNVSFYNVVTSLCSKQISMSATVDSKFQTLTSDVLSAVNTKVNALTANYPRLFEVYPNTITIPSGSNNGKTDFNSELGNILVNDINVIPTNMAAANTNWCLLLSSIQNPGSPPDPTPYTYTITISTASNSVGNSTFETKVLKYF
jgi:hypothetical protein